MESYLRFFIFSFFANNSSIDSSDVKRPPFDAPRQDESNELFHYFLIMGWRDNAVLKLIKKYCPVTFDTLLYMYIKTLWRLTFSLDGVFFSDTVNIRRLFVITSGRVLFYYDIANPGMVSDHEIRSHESQFS